MPDDERADPLSMTSKAAFTTEEVGSEVECIDVGVQISPSKKMLEFKQDAGVFQLVSAMKRCTLIELNIIIVIYCFVEGVK